MKRACAMLSMLAVGLNLGLVARAEPPARTVVEKFTPAAAVAAAKPALAGQCWVGSLAAARADAWRCMAGNAIYDPCFASSLAARTVVCGAEPARHLAGFAMRLTKPLPQAEANHTPAAPAPWLVQLADGSVCAPFTGTLPFMGGEVARYGCSDSKQCRQGACEYLTGLTDNFTRGGVWTADKLIYSAGADGARLRDRKRVKVKMVWE